LFAVPVPLAINSGLLVARGFPELKYLQYVQITRDDSSILDRSGSGQGLVEIVSLDGLHYEEIAILSSMKISEGGPKLFEKQTPACDMRRHLITSE
jgi:hypothetical protein